MVRVHCTHRLARSKIRDELVAFTTEGDTQGLRDKLDELAMEALQHRERPRGNAEVRDEPRPLPSLLS